MLIILEMSVIMLKTDRFHTVKYIISMMAITQMIVKFVWTLITMMETTAYLVMNSKTVMIAWKDAKLVDKTSTLTNLNA